MQARCTPCVSLFCALLTDASTFRENKSGKSETVHDPRTDTTTAVLSQESWEGQTGFQLTPLCPVYRWAHEALCQKQCKNVSEVQPQKTQQFYIMQALLLQPAHTEKARLIFIHPF